VALTSTILAKYAWRDAQTSAVSLQTREQQYIDEVYAREEATFEATSQVFQVDINEKGKRLTVYCTKLSENAPATARDKRTSILYRTRAMRLGESTTSCEPKDENSRADHVEVSFARLDTNSAILQVPRGTREKQQNERRCAAQY